MSGAADGSPARGGPAGRGGGARNTVVLLLDRSGGSDEEEMLELLRVALHAVEAPEEQFARLGIA